MEDGVPIVCGVEPVARTHSDWMVVVGVPRSVLLAEMQRIGIHPFILVRLGGVDPHAPVRENCLSCHDPHGSTNEYLLKVSRPRLCAECHGFGHFAIYSGPVAPESFARSCQNCHTAIHGSNSPSGALLQR